MDPRDLLRAFPDGITCTVCDEPVPVARVRLLARREDMTFVQIDCGGCRSTTLGFLADSSLLPAAADGPSPGADPVTSDDVIEMHRFLAGWQGDARSLVADDGPDVPRHERSTPPR
jgi:hypothetical protein